MVIWKYVPINEDSLFWQYYLCKLIYKFLMVPVHPIMVLLS